MLIAVGVLLGGIVGFNAFKGYMIKKYMAPAPMPPATVSTIKADFEQWQPQLERGRHPARRARRRRHDRDRRPRAQHRIQVGRGGEGGRACWSSSTPTPTSRSCTRCEAAADLAATVLERDKAQLDGAGDQHRRRSTRRGRPEEQAGAGRAAGGDRRQEDASARRSPASSASRTVNPGQYLNPGDKIVTLQTHRSDLRRLLPAAAADAAGLRSARRSTLASDAYRGHQRSPARSPRSTRRSTPARATSQIEATLPNPKRQLLPGMFANGRGRRRRRRSAT